MPRDLALYLFARFCFAAAMAMFRAAVAWHVFHLSHSAFHLGLIGLVQFAPVLALTLVGGALADTYDRRRIMMLSQLLPLAVAAVLVAATHSGADSLPLLYTAAIV